MRTEPVDSKKKLRIAMWTPLPPLKTGVADYVTELLPYLAHDFDLEIFVNDDYIVSGHLNEHYKIYTYHSYPERQEAGEFDLNIYQIGNNEYHIYIYEQALKVPGLIIIHDLSISFMLYHYHAGLRNDLTAFKKEFAFSEGEEALKQFERFYNSGDNAALMEFFSNRYALRRLVGRNYALVSHLAYGADVARQKYDAKHVYSMYLGSPDPGLELPGVSKAKARADLKILDEQFVVGIFGHLQPNKQNEVMLHALAKVKAGHPNVLAAFVGEINRSLRYDQQLMDLIQKLKISENVRMTGFVTRSDMQKYYLASDVIVNLRYPSFGQMSATLSRAIATGRPVIITDLPEWQFFPESYCWRVPAEDTEGKRLAELVSRLIKDRKELEQRGQAARDYYNENGTSQKAAENLKAIILDILDNVPKRVDLAEQQIVTPSLPEMVRLAFENWDNLRAGGNKRYLFEKLRKVPLIGSFLFAFCVLLANLTHARQLRRAEWALYKTLMDSISKLETDRIRLDAAAQRLVAETRGLELETRRLETETRTEYQPELVRIWDDPLGTIPGYTTPTDGRRVESPNEDFYIALEQAFRGPVEIIRQRQSQVLEQIKSYIDLEKGVPILDIGCGRGEFLSLLKEDGLRPIGIDNNITLIKQLQHNGFEVYAQDAFEYLMDLPDETLKGITAFHVIEHLDHQEQMTLLELAYKKLAVGGFIYLETPNPLCPDSLGRFYTDPTHHRPLQPFQLSFLLEYNRFSKLRVLFLEPVSARGSLSSERWITLYQDFGVLGSKENI